MRENKRAKRKGGGSDSLAVVLWGRDLVIGGTQERGGVLHQVPGGNVTWNVKRRLMPKGKKLNRCLK